MEDDGDDVERGNRRRWYIDKSIPLPTLVLLGIQTLGLAFWLGSLSRDVQDQGVRLKEVVARANDLNKVDVLLAEIRLKMTFMEGDLSRLTERVSVLERR